ncbi:MAG: Flp pilus assembly protein CpaB [bacterium]|nr:Flp pilus assembly protein CpaB [bacterium]MCP4965136.1 Flp pilus assembly protein CpaB [bacterium]
MGKRSLVLIIALALAAVSAFSVWQYLTTVEDEARSEVQEVIVYRATELIDTGTSVAEAEALIVESTALVEAVVFEGSTIACDGPAANSDAPLDVCGRNPRIESVLDPINVAAGPISAGQLVTADLFVPPNLLSDIKLSESIPEGKVAISFRPTEESTVGGFVRPGDRVNLIASASVDLTQSTALLQDPELRTILLGEAAVGDESTGSVTDPETGEPEDDAVARLAQSLPGAIDFTQTVLQDVEVLAVGPDTRPSPIGTGLEPAGAQIVVLEVTPEQAEKIEFAQQYTSVSLALIPSGENASGQDKVYNPITSEGVIVDDLFTLIDRIREQFEEAGVLLGNG